MCVLAGLVLTGAAGAEERWDLAKFRALLPEYPVCGPQFEVAVDHLEPAINGQPVPPGAGDLEAALYATLAQNMFDCSFLQFLAATAIGDPEINAALRDLGLPVPLDPDRARAAFRRLAVYDANTEEDHLDGLPEFLQRFGFAAPAGLAEGRLWAESLGAMTADALLAEARLHQAQDDDLSKYLERMAALKGSPEAAILVARRALADPGFSDGPAARFVLGHYLARAVLAGAEDLEEDLQRIHPEWRVREYLMERAHAGDYPYERHLLWR